MKFSNVVSHFGFNSCARDFVLFIQKTGEGTILLLLYMDEMLIMSNDLDVILKLKEFLNYQFEMKDLGTLQLFPRF